MKNEMLTQYDSCPVISSSESDLFLTYVEALSRRRTTKDVRLFGSNRFKRVL